MVTGPGCLLLNARLMKQSPHWGNLHTLQSLLLDHNQIKQSFPEQPSFPRGGVWICGGCIHSSTNCFSQTGCSAGLAAAEPPN